MDPETSLYDGSTRKWLKAADAPVVRFILEEMERDGVELPPAWESESAADVPGDPPQGPPSPSEDQGSDPLEIGLTLAPLDDMTEDAGEVGDRRSAAPSAAPAPIEVGARDWMTPRSVGGLVSTAEEEGSPGGTVWAGEVDSGSPASPVGSDGPLEARGARKEWWLAGFLIGAVALVGMGLLLGDRQRADQSTLSGAEGQQSGVSGVDTDPEPEATLGAASLPVPPGLEGVAQRSAELVVQRYQAAADSIRRAQGVSVAPPGQWLSGNYLANAGDFPEVPQFWSAYGRFVEELRVSDRTLFLDILSQELGPGVSEPEQLPALEGYLRDRYAVTFPGRQELHDQLASVAGVALDLHEFLVDKSEAIQFTPALGTSAVARDPVLEVGTEDPEVQRELELHLDRLFQALDRSRGGGAPSLSGLRAELFGGFAPF